MDRIVGISSGSLESLGVSILGFVGAKEIFPKPNFICNKSSLVRYCVSPERTTSFILTDCRTRWSTRGNTWWFKKTGALDAIIGDVILDKVSSDHDAWLVSLRSNDSSIDILCKQIDLHEWMPKARFESSQIEPLIDLLLLCRVFLVMKKIWGAANYSIDTNCSKCFGREERHHIHGLQRSLYFLNMYQHSQLCL